VGRLLLLLAAVVLAGCGDGTTAQGTGRTGSRSPSTGAAAAPFQATATAVRTLPGGAGFAITVEVPAGHAGCNARTQARYDAHENHIHYVTTTFERRHQSCPETQQRVVEVRAPVRGEDLALNHELWRPGPGHTYVRCSTELGCHPPRDRCADVWVRALVAGAELPPERQVTTVACADGWLVLRIDAVVTGCQSVDGAAPPPGCAGTGTHTRWFARLGPDRRWEVVASGTAAGCADVAAVPGFPERLCRRLPVG
jgi:hypothetical protein